MNDLISRQEAINRIESHIRALDGGEVYPLTETDKAINYALEVAASCVYNLPSAQQEQRWIPVSERLPENTEPVNITWVNRNPVPYYADIKDKPFTATGHYCNGRWWWYSALCQDYLDEYGECKMDEMDGDIEVIAWRELPEPYKEGENND